MHTLRPETERHKAIVVNIDYAREVNLFSRSQKIVAHLTNTEKGDLYQDYY